MSTLASCRISTTNEPEVWTTFGATSVTVTIIIAGNVGVRFEAGCSLAVHCINAYSTYTGNGDTSEDGYYYTFLLYQP
jgi:hypothetical protein